MNRAAGLPLIHEHIQARPWFCYMNPHLGKAVQISRPLLDNADLTELVPNDLDRAKALAFEAVKMAKASPIEFIGVTAHAPISQIEIFLGGVACYIIFHEGQWWLSEAEFFPFE